MFWNKFRTACPLDLSSKVRIETGYHKLACLLRDHPATKAGILTPDARDYGELVSGSLEPGAVAERICDRLRIAPGLNVVVVPDATLTDAAGLYWRREREIHLPVRVLEIPEQLLGVLIHEILHDLLLQQQILSGSEPDHEELTDLASVLVGLAVPLANMTIRDQTHQSGAYSYWQIERVGYLTSQEFGYALALNFHLHRREFPGWARLIRRDAQVAFRDGLKFLDRTKDHFVCDRGDGGALDHDPHSLGELLSRGSPAQVLAAIGWASEHFFR